MRILEVGIMARGYPLVYSTYYQIENKSYDMLLKAAVLTGLINLLEFMFSKSSLEYIESGSYIIVIEKSKIKCEDSNKPESIFAYLIFNKIKFYNIDKFVSKKIKPYLVKILNIFKNDYKGINLSSVHEFKSFQFMADKFFKKGIIR